MTGLLNGGPPEAGASASGAVLLAAALDTAIVLTKKAAVTQSAAEAKDFAAGVLALAQATAVLDPNRDQQGIPVADQHARAIDMQHLKGQQELERWRVKTEIRKFDGDLTAEEIDAGAAEPFEVVEDEGNLLLIGGVSRSGSC
jgi:cell division septum initiation protein DivIVA